MNSAVHVLALHDPGGKVHLSATPAEGSGQYPHGMSQSISDPDPYEAQTGFDDDDWERDHADSAAFDAGDDELEIEEDRAHER